ncbi:signal peptidase II [Patescibacteria group bacterium]
MKKIFKKIYNIKTITFFIVIVFCLDRIFKYLALNNKIFFYKNPGITFSIKIPENLFLYFYILVFLILIILIHFLIKEIKNKNLLLITSYALLIIGAASNLIDRFKFNYVIDYLNFYFFYNNLADIAICFGIILLIINLFKK